MLSAVATVHSQCIFDAQFSYRVKYPDNVFVVWRLNNVFIKRSTHFYKLQQCNNTYTLYLKSVHGFMAGRVFCELHERLTPDRSRVLEVQQGKLTVLHVEWFDNSPKTTTLYQYGGAVALIPYVFGDEQGATTKIHIKNNNLLLYYVSEPFVDDNIDTFLMLFIYKCENQIIYIKIVYDPTVFNHNTLKVERTRQITCCPMKVQSNLKVKWDFIQGPNNCFTYEVTDHAGVFANVSPIPPDQVSKRAELTLLDPPKHKLIAVRVRTAKPLPGQPEPDYKHVVLRSAPAQARAPAQASASAKTGAIVMACTPATEPTPGPSSQD